MNYRKLLKSYMNLVEEQEGVTFVNWAGLDNFTEEEIQELKKINEGESPHVKFDYIEAKINQAEELTRRLEDTQVADCITELTDAVETLLEVVKDN